MQVAGTLRFSAAVAAPVLELALAHLPLCTRVSNKFLTAPAQSQKLFRIFLAALVDS